LTMSTPTQRHHSQQNQYSLFHLALSADVKIFLSSASP
jgi:hypothetical protein